jgi:hypothetical protein
VLLHGGVLLRHTHIRKPPNIRFIPNEPTEKGLVSGVLMPAICYNLRSESTVKRSVGLQRKVGHKESTHTSRRVGISSPELKRHPPKTSEHLMTQSNSQSKGAQNTLTKIMLDDVAGVSDLEVLRPLSLQ